VFAISILYAGGLFTGAGSVAANGIARWDPSTSSWQSLGSGVNSDYGERRIHALAFGPDRSLYVGGHFTTAGDAVSNCIAQWSGEVFDNAIWLPLVLR
jgi:hypothetical protein